MHDLKEMIRTVPDFPKAGINFLDITPILSDQVSFQRLLKSLQQQIDWSQIDVIIGIESRGFVLAAALAAQTHKGLVLCRKAGKLPPPVSSASYALEYGNATIEMSPGKGRALIVDDVLATGGTLQAAITVATAAGYQVEDLLVLIDITALNSFTFKNKKVKSLLPC